VEAGVLITDTSFLLDAAPLAAISTSDTSSLLDAALRSAAGPFCLTAAVNLRSADSHFFCY
jgi:hypothetical protein